MFFFIAFICLHEESIPFWDAVGIRRPSEIDYILYQSRRMGKPTICIGEIKGADQLRSNCEAGVGNKNIFVSYT